jgi:gamma-glutamyltranspeptidase/glutathione hydrolase
MTIGTMGGDAQPQVLLQLLTRLLHHDQSPGAAMRAARWALTGSARSGFDTWSDPDGVRVEIEADGAGWAGGLAERGHEVKVVDQLGSTFGHAHVIAVDGDGMLGGCADPRALIGATAGY